LKSCKKKKKKKSLTFKRIIRLTQPVKMVTYPTSLQFPSLEIEVIPKPFQNAMKPV
jgi:hypothetical protein